MALSAAAASGLMNLVGGTAKLSESGQGVSQGNYAGGIGQKILGAPGDPGGALLNLVMDINTRRNQKRQFAAEMAEKKREFDIAAAQNNRQQNLTGLDALANQRYLAQASARTQAFRKGLSAIGG